MNGLFILLVTVAVAAANIVQPREVSRCVENESCSKLPIGSLLAVQFADEEDCHKFYKCSYGKACLWECPMYDSVNRLVYNPVDQVCDWPENVPNRPNCSGPNALAFLKDEPNGCPTVGDAFIKHETNCNYYYSCHNGKRTLQKCGEGLVFNPYMEVCDLPSNYACEQSQ
ncbi:unnamed protein product [Xylocopa violacea]|uniref:Chitin-binding type-2 domain-containing protein n=1 Tax=Xylocopa violacea TaxID=135666 RepID=A0ABP1PEA0_XYLVO